MELNEENGYLFNVIDNVREQFRHSLEQIRKNLKHKGLKGTALEIEVMREFFNDRYPFLKVSGGEIVGVNNYRSNQIDIILYSSEHTPVFYRNNETRVLPIEGVLGTVEVKAKLSTTHLKDAVKQSVEIKQTPKFYFKSEEEHKRTYKINGKKFNYFPTQTMLVGFEGITIDTIIKTLSKEYITVPPENRLDFIYVATQGFVYNDIQTNKICVVRDLRHALFLFYCRSYAILSAARIYPPMINAYGENYSIHIENYDM